MDNDYQVAKYDRIRGGLVGVGLFTKASTIQNVQTITGKSETFIVETCRHDELGGDFLFIQMIDENGSVTRMALPPKVSAVIASQKDALTTKRRRITGKRLAKERMDRGEVPGFMRKSKRSVKA